MFPHDFLAMLDEEDGCFDEQASFLLAYTLHESPLWWLCSLSADKVHSLEHFCDLIEDTFHHFDPKPLDQKLLQQRKTPYELHTEFWDRFCVLKFQAPKIQMKLQYLMDRFEYCLTKSINPKRKFKLKARSAYYHDGAAQSQTNTVIVTSECPPSPHKIAPRL